MTTTVRACAVKHGLPLKHAKIKGLPGYMEASRKAYQDPDLVKAAAYDACRLGQPQEDVALRIPGWPGQFLGCAHDVFLRVGRRAQFRLIWPVGPNLG